MRNRANTVIFLLVFLLPLVAFSIYEIVYATNRYDSNAQLVIIEEAGTTTGLDLSVLGLPAPSSSRDALVTMAFITSVDMMNHLEAKMHMRAHFSGPKLDWWSRLDPNASMEDFHTYLQRFLIVTYDIDSQIISIGFQGFDRQYSQDVLNAVLARAQEFIDKLNSKITTEQTAFFERQLKDSEARLRDTKSLLLKFQRNNLLLTTTAQAELVNSNIAGLDKLLIQKQGELANALKEFSETSPTVHVLRSEIDSLKIQLEQERNRLSGGSSEAVSELDAKFREIEFNLEFVTAVYKSNLTQLEQAHIDAVRRLKYLIVVTQPTLPDESTFPDRFYMIGTAIILLLMIFFIVSLITAIIREHS